MKRDAPIKKLYDEIISLLPTSAATSAFIVFILSAITVTAVSLIFYDYWDPEFWKNIRVEAHGMLFDILVIGVLILFLNKLAEKQIANRRYLDEIDDFREWKSKEAVRRIAGNLKRLKRYRYKGKIDLTKCYLCYAGFQTERLRECLEYFPKWLAGINLRKGDLSCAHLQGADLRGAVLVQANLPGADLRGVRNLTLDQLSEVKSLYRARLDPELMEQVQEKYPHLLEEADRDNKK
jgi:hypothetical protein